MMNSEMYSDAIYTGNKEVGTVYDDEATKIQDSFGEYLEYNKKSIDDIGMQTDKIGETIDGYVSEAIGVKL